MKRPNNDGRFRRAYRALRAQLQDAADRTALLTVGSVFLNGTTGVWKLWTGLAGHSAWLVTNALYDLVLCAARLTTLRAYFAAERSEDDQTAQRIACYVYRQGGTLLCLIGISYYLVCLCMAFVGDASTHSGAAAYTAVAIAASKAVYAGYALVLTRRQHGRILVTLKTISVADACVSAVAALCTVLTVFPRLDAVPTGAALGMACASFFVFWGARMRQRTRCAP